MIFPEWNPIRVRVKKSPPCRLVCPLGGKEPGCKEGPLFDRSQAAGQWGWIVQDMTKDPISDSRCGACKREFKGRNIAVEQGATLLVLMDSDYRAGQAWDITNCYTYAPDEVRVYARQDLKKEKKDAFIYKSK